MRGVYLVCPMVGAVVFIRLTMIYPKRIHHNSAAVRRFVTSPGHFGRLPVAVLPVGVRAVNSIVTCASLALRENAAAGQISSNSELRL